MSILTIAHMTGSGGPEIGMAAAAELGYRYVDREMLSQAALKYGVVEDKLAQVDETKPSLFERFDVETRQYITVIQSGLLDVAEEDNVVINSRGGQILLRGIPHVLRVRVIAPFDLRVKRVMEKLGGKMGETVDFRTTAEMVRRSDQEKYGRIRYLYDLDWGDPALYDVILNTERLTIEAAVELLVRLLRRAEMVATPASTLMRYLLVSGWAAKAARTREARPRSRTVCREAGVATISARRSRRTRSSTAASMVSRSVFRMTS